MASGGQCAIISLVQVKQLLPVDSLDSQTTFHMELLARGMLGIIYIIKDAKFRGQLVFPTIMIQKYVRSIHYTNSGSGPLLP